MNVHEKVEQKLGEYLSLLSDEARDRVLETPVEEWTYGTATRTTGVRMQRCLIGITEDWSVQHCGQDRDMMLLRFDEENKAIEGLFDTPSKFDGLVELYTLPIVVAEVKRLCGEAVEITVVEEEVEHANV